jgi:hypothetical protein
MQTSLLRAGADQEALERGVEILELEAASEKPKDSKIRAALMDVRNAVSGVAGNLIATGVLAEIGKLLGS